MSRSSFYHPDTIALHSGYVPESDHGSRAVPIYQTTSYVFESVSDASSLFNVEQGAHSRCCADCTAATFKRGNALL